MKQEWGLYGGASAQWTTPTPTSSSGQASAEMSLRDESSTAQSSRASSIQPSQSRLHPQDAFLAFSPPRKRSLGRSDTVTKHTAEGEASHARRDRDRRRGRSSSRRRRSGHPTGKGQWKKLLWVKQSYPDNYTDEETFLDHLQRNPRLRPYEFWPLVADSTIIVQHVCSVIIFVCCFTAIFQERVVPQTVVGWATSGTVIGWIILDYWQTREEFEEGLASDVQQPSEDSESTDKDPSTPASDAASFGQPFKEHHVPLVGTANGRLSHTHSPNPSLNSVGASNFATSPIFAPGEAHGASLPPAAPHVPPWNGPPSSLSPRMRQRLATIKSAVLIYCSLLGLSPILKSLTKSTSSDSIWALSSWLMILNVMTFDYGAGPEAKFPAPLSTNAALMASTVLASRLPSTTHVFSLTLFSIEVFGLFPVFRRHLRHHSWTGHLWLTAFLVVLASGGLSMTISGGSYLMGIVGMVLGVMITSLSLGLTSWWLIGLQRYKNEIHGPWDPARPIIRRHWD